MSRRRTAGVLGLLLIGLTAAPVFGAPRAAAPRPFVLTGEADGDQAGFQVATGDLDGDGRQDLVVDAWRSDRGGEDSGAVYIEYGPVRSGFRLAAADVVLVAPKAGDYAGEGPLGILDLDGDGADELVVGTPGPFLVGQPGSPKVGETYLLYGGRRMRGVVELPAVADALFTGVQVQEWLGFGAAGVGDLDADGLEDLVIGAPATAAYSGAAYLFYGARKRHSGSVPVTSADATIVGGRATQMFGYEAEGGDLDGDGAADLVLSGGSFPAPSPTSWSLFYGRPGHRLSGTLPAAAAEATLLSPGNKGNLTISATWVVADHDLTGDGRHDLALGDAATLNSDVKSHVWVVAGGARLAGVQLVDRVAMGEIDGAGHVVSVGDIDGDRRSDLVVGGPAAGTVAVVRGPLRAGVAAPLKQLLPAAPAAGLGAALAMGDVTGDGRLDVVVGAPREAAGRVHVLPGGR